MYSGSRATALSSHLQFTMILMCMVKKYGSYNKKTCKRFKCRPQILSTSIQMLFCLVFFSCFSSLEHNNLIRCWFHDHELISNEPYFIKQNHLQCCKEQCQHGIPCLVNMPAEKRRIRM